MSNNPLPDPQQLELDLATVVEVAYPLVPTALPSWALPPFTGKKTPCAKCGYGAAENDAEVQVTFHAEGHTHFPCGDMLFVNMPLFHAIGFPEHLCRTCPVCHHGWVELLVDIGRGL